MLSDQEWDDAYNAAEAKIPADVTGLRRVRMTFEEMGYREIDDGPVDFSGLDKYFWPKDVPYPYPPEQQA